jgi:hypothetical protein
VDYGVVSYQDILRQPWVIEDGWIVLEYPTLFGGSAFTRIHLDVDEEEIGRIEEEIKALGRVKHGDVPQ